MDHELAQLIDIKGAMTRLCGNRSLYVKMLRLFLSEEEMPAFEAAFSENALETAAAHVHAIKGVAGNLSFPALFAQSAKLSSSLRLGEKDSVLADEFRQSYAATHAMIPRAIELLETDDASF